MQTLRLVELCTSCGSTAYVLLVAEEPLRTFCFAEVAVETAYLYVICYVAGSCLEPVLSLSFLPLCDVVG